MYRISDSNAVESFRLEYAFYDVMRAHNEARVAEATPRDLYPDGVIPRSLAMRLHDDVNARLLAGGTQSMDWDPSSSRPMPSRAAVEAAVREVVTPLMGHDPYDGTSVDAQCADFDDWAGIDGGHGRKPSDMALPLSPYDPKVRDLSVSHMVGNQLLFVTGDTLSLDSGTPSDYDPWKLLHDCVGGRGVAVSTAEVGLIRGLRPEGLVKPVTVTVRGRDGKPERRSRDLITTHDVTGVSILEPYLSPESRRDLMAWAERPYARNRSRGDDEQSFERQLIMRDSAAGREYREAVHTQMRDAAAYIEDLRDRGYDVDVTKAQRAGQLQMEARKGDDNHGRVTVRLTGRIPVMRVRGADEDADLVRIEPNAAGMGAQLVTVDQLGRYYASSASDRFSFPFGQVKKDASGVERSSDDSAWVGQAYDSTSGITASLSMAKPVYGYGKGAAKADLDTRRVGGYARPSRGSRSDQISAETMRIPGLSLLGESIDGIASDMPVGSREARFTGDGPLMTFSALNGSTAECFNAQARAFYANPNHTPEATVAFVNQMHAQGWYRPHWYRDDGSRVLGNRFVPLQRGDARIPFRPTYVGKTDGRTMVGLAPVLSHRRADLSDRPFVSDYLCLEYTNKNDSSFSIGNMTPEKASEKVAELVNEAYFTLQTDLDVVSLSEAARHEAETGELPETLDVANEEVSTLRENLYELLAGRATSICIPVADDASTLDDTSASPVTDVFGLDESLEPDAGYRVFSVENAEDADERFRVASEAASTFIDNYIGSFEPSPIDGRTFNPAHVAEFSGAGGIVGRNSLVAYLRRAWQPVDGGFSVYDLMERIGTLRGSDESKAYLADRLVAFDKDTATSLDGMPAGDMRTALETVRDSVASMGYAISDADVSVDARGVVHYEATRRYHAADSFFSNTRDGSSSPWQSSDDDVEGTHVSGEVGQVFVPRADGLVETSFVASENSLMAVGYRGVVRGVDPTGGIDVACRTHPEGYMDRLTAELRRRVRVDLAQSAPRRDVVGESSSLNVLYRHLDAERYPLDYVEREIESGNPESLVHARIDDALNKTTFSRRMVDAAGVINVWDGVRDLQSKYQTAPGRLGDDTYRDDAARAGRLFAVPSEEFAKRFAVRDTQDNKSQMATTYLGEGFELDAEGHVVAGDGPVQAPLEAWLMRMNPSCQYDTLFRQRMAIANVRDSIAIVSDVARDPALIAAQDAGIEYVPGDGVEPTRHTHGVLAAQMTMRGWCQDDGFVISSELAKSLKVPDWETRKAEGGDPNAMRSVRVGDKLSDFHGNKGTVAVVVDRAWTGEEAESRGLYEEWDVFRHNPALDVVMSPYSGVSRDNAGTAREMMQHPHNLCLKGEDGSWSVENGRGCAGELSLIVHDKLADAKTTIYDNDALRGRHLGWQSSSSLIARGCENFMAETYGANERGMRDMREYLLTCGVTLSPEGRLGTDAKAAMDGRTEVKGPYAFDSPTLADDIPGLHKADQGYGPAAYGKRSKTVTEAARAITSTLSREGGYLRLPFPLTFPKAVSTEGGMKSELGGDSIPQGADGSWELPVLSAGLRAGSETQDGVTRVHDYTNRYERIYERSLMWGLASNALKNPELYSGKPDDVTRKASEIMQRCQRDAQRDFDSITSDIMEHKVCDSKWNGFASSVMRTSVNSHAATAVWTPDPRLRIDQVRIGEALADKLGLSDGDHALVWRDPALISSAMRSLEVVVDHSPVGDPNRVYGVAVNPAVTTAMSGDFDGDTIAIINPATKAAKDEVAKRLSFESNIMTFDLPKHDGHGNLLLDEHGNKVYDFDLCVGAGDLAVAYHDDDDARTNIEDLKAQALTPLGEKVTLSTGAEVEGYGILSRDAVLTDERVAANATKLVDELSETVDGIMDFGVCGNHALKYASTDANGELVPDAKAYLGSLWDNVVATGAKGNPRRFAQYCDYFGADVQRDEKGVALDKPFDEGGRPDFDAMRDTGVPFGGDAERRYAADQDTLLAMVTKSQTTGQAGTVLKVALAAFGAEGGDAIRMAQGLSEGLYQMTLDVKTDPDRARRAIEALGTQVPELLYKGTDPTGVPMREGATMHPGVDYDKRTKRLSPDKWCERLFDLYEHVGIEGRLNPEDAHALAERMCDADGFVMGMSEVIEERSGGLLYQLAFRPSANRLFKAAEDGRSLVDTGLHDASVDDDKTIAMTRESVIANYCPNSTRVALGMSVLRETQPAMTVEGDAKVVEGVPQGSVDVSPYVPVPVRSDVRPRTGLPRDVNASTRVMDHSMVPKGDYTPKVDAVSPSYEGSVDGADRSQSVKSMESEVNAAALDVMHKLHTLSAKSASHDDV